MMITAKMIADAVKGKIIGNEKVTIDGFSKIEETQENTITFINSSKYINFLKTAKASVIIINNNMIDEVQREVNNNVTLIVVDDAYSAIVTLMNLYTRMTSSNVELKVSDKVDISSTANLKGDCFIGSFTVIGNNSIVGENVKIYDQVHIGNNVEIGDNTIIYPGVKIYDNTKIGNDCIIHSGTVIGSDGFGFLQQHNKNIKVPQLGNVEIHNDVEIGANCTIDRATMGSTVIADGVKLDNLIHIAHNCFIGENTVIASQTGIAGSTVIGKNCMIGGQVGMIDHIKIGDNVKIIAKSGLMKNVPDNEIVMGAPAFNYRDFMRSYNCFKKLPDDKN